MVEPHLGRASAEEINQERSRSGSTRTSSSRVSSIARTQSSTESPPVAVENQCEAPKLRSAQIDAGSNRTRSFTRHKKQQKSKRKLALWNRNKHKATFNVEDIGELMEAVTTRIRATEALSQQPLREEQLMNIVRDVLESCKRKHGNSSASEKDSKNGEKGNPQSVKESADVSLHQLVIMLMDLLMQQRNRHEGVLRSFPYVAAATRDEHISENVSVVTTERTEFKDSSSVAWVSTVTSQPPNMDFEKPDVQISKIHHDQPKGQYQHNEIDGDGVEYTLDQLQTMLSIVKAAHHEIEDDDSSEWSNASSLDPLENSFSEDVYTFDYVFEQLINMIPVPEVPQGFPGLDEDDTSLDALQEQSYDDETLDGVETPSDKHIRLVTEDITLKNPLVEDLLSTSIESSVDSVAKEALDEIDEGRVANRTVVTIDSPLTVDAPVPTTSFFSSIFEGNYLKSRSLSFEKDKACVAPETRNERTPDDITSPAGETSIFESMSSIFTNPFGEARPHSKDLGNGPCSIPCVAPDIVVPKEPSLERDVVPNADEGVGVETSEHLHFVKISVDDLLKGLAEDDSDAIFDEDSESENDSIYNVLLGQSLPNKEPSEKRHEVNFSRDRVGNVYQILAGELRLQRTGTVANVDDASRGHDKPASTPDVFLEKHCRLPGLSRISSFDQMLEMESANQSTLLQVRSTDDSESRPKSKNHALTMKLRHEVDPAEEASWDRLEYPLEKLHIKEREKQNIDEQATDQTNSMNRNHRPSMRTRPLFGHYLRAKNEDLDAHLQEMVSQTGSGSRDQQDLSGSCPIADSCPPEKTRRKSFVRKQSFTNLAAAKMFQFRAERGLSSSESPKKSSRGEFARRVSASANTSHDTIKVGDSSKESGNSTQFAVTILYSQQFVEDDASTRTHQVVQLAASGNQGFSESLCENELSNPSINRLVENYASSQDSPLFSMPATSNCYDVHGFKVHDRFSPTLVLSEEATKEEVMSVDCSVEENLASSAPSQDSAFFEKEIQGETRHAVAPSLSEYVNNSVEHAWDQKELPWEEVSGMRSTESFEPKPRTPPERTRKRIGDWVSRQSMALVLGGAKTMQNKKTDTSSASLTSVPQNSSNDIEGRRKRRAKRTSKSAVKDTNHPQHKCEPSPHNSPQHEVRISVPTREPSILVCKKGGAPATKQKSMKLNSPQMMVQHQEKSEGGPLQNPTIIICKKGGAPVAEQEYMKANSPEMAMVYKEASEGKFLQESTTLICKKGGALANKDYQGKETNALDLSNSVLGTDAALIVPWYAKYLDQPDRYDTPTNLKPTEPMSEKEHYLEEETLSINGLKDEVDTHNIPDSPACAKPESPCFVEEVVQGKADAIEGNPLWEVFPNSPFNIEATHDIPEIQSSAGTKLNDEGSKLLNGGPTETFTRGESDYPSLSQKETAFYVDPGISELSEQKQNVNVDANPSFDIFKNAEASFRKKSQRQPTPKRSNLYAKGQWEFFHPDHEAAMSSRGEVAPVIGSRARAALTDHRLRKAGSDHSSGNVLVSPSSVAATGPIDQFEDTEFGQLLNDPLTSFDVETSFPPF